MMVEKMVSGISQYPELAQQLQSRLDRLGPQGCSSCEKSAIIREFRSKLKSIQDRERLSKGYSKG
jgi:hypothetical protein